VIAACFLRETKCQLMQMPTQQMPEGRHANYVERRQMLHQINRFAEKVPHDERNQHYTEDPENQKFIFQSHGQPPGLD
jgi:hypothetical protein